MWHQSNIANSSIWPLQVPTETENRGFSPEPIIIEKKDPPPIKEHSRGATKNEPATKQKWASESKKISLSTMTKLTTLWSWCLFRWLLSGALGLVPPSIPSRSVSKNTRRAIVLRQQDRRVVDSGADFFRERQSDFMRLEASDEEFGPGPALIFYNVPQGLQDEELVDMLRDGAPKAIRKGVSLSRMDTSTSNEWMDLSLEEALNKVVRNSRDPHARKGPDPLATDAGILATTPVLFFSGFRNSEMMATFNIISHEVHKETGGRLAVACAMAVPDAMKKPLRQVLYEISGDHQESFKPFKAKTA